MTEKVEIFHSKVITGFDKDGEIYQRLIPFEWQSLTDEEMHKALTSVDPATKRLPIGFARFARAIEAKLKEKNHA